MIPALIIARSGSTGFPGKNVFPVLGRPLMTYPLLAAQESKLVDCSYISTDSAEMRTIGVDYGAEYIERPPELCTNTALGEDAFKHGYEVIRDRLADEGESLELIVLLFANLAQVTPVTLSHSSIFGLSFCQHSG